MMLLKWRRAVLGPPRSAATCRGEVDGPRALCRAELFVGPLHSQEVEYCVELPRRWRSSGFFFLSLLSRRVSIEKAIIALRIHCNCSVCVWYICLKLIVHGQDMALM